MCKSLAHYFIHFLSLALFLSLCHEKSRQELSLCLREACTVQSNISLERAPIRKDNSKSRADHLISDHCFEGLTGVNRQPSKTEYFYRQPSNEWTKISRQISFLNYFLNFFKIFKIFLNFFKQFFKVFLNNFFNSRIKYEHNYIALLNYLQPNLCFKFVW